MLLPVPVAVLRPVLSPDHILAEAQAYFMGCLAREPLLDREDARDLASDVVAAVLPRLDQLDAPLRYVIKMCRHRLIRFLARKRTRVRHGPVIQELALQAAAPAEEASFGDTEHRQLALIRRLLGRTDGLTRQVVLLRSETDLTYTEIAELVDRRPASIRMRYLRFSRRVQSAWAKGGHSVDPF